jgi:predicted LPLAT superfamily acyltransferase
MTTADKLPGEIGRKGGKADAEWAGRSERSNLGILRLMVWISLNLGRSAGRVILHLIAGYFLVFAPSARRASRAYLGRVLGRPPRLAELYRHVFCFAATIHDRVYLLNERFDLFDLRVAGTDALHEAMNDGQGVFLIGAHMGSFEVMRSLGRQHGLNVAMVMYEENARKINATLAAINPSIKQDIIPLGHMESMLNVRSRLQQGAAVGFLADRALDSGQMTDIPFLGARASFSDGPWRMAAMLRRPALFMVGLYRGGNRYDIHFEPLADFRGLRGDELADATRAAQCRYVTLLEHYCHAAPDNWFNFFDFWHTHGTA